MCEDGRIQQKDIQGDQTMFPKKESDCLHLLMPWGKTTQHICNTRLWYNGLVCTYMVQGTCVYR